MRRLLRPQAGASALRASAAAAPASGITFVDNSRGASAATAELSTALDSALDQIDFTADPDEHLGHLVQKLDLEASNFSNSKVDEKVCAGWACPQSTAQTVSVAWKCVLRAYDATGDMPSASYCTFQHDHAAAPSIGGSTKALVSTVVRPAQVAGAATHEFLPALVIAVRRSDSKLDHMVNANSESRNASDFIGRPVDAHSGFLNSARAPDAVVSKRICLYLQEHRAGAHVIFTGHSAGGAVASLPLLSHLFDSSGKESTARLSCITFGTPPAVLTAIYVAVIARRPLGLCLNINEFDVVARADRPYVLCPVNLLRSMYGQPAIIGNNTGAGGSNNSEPPDNPGPGGQLGNESPIPTNHNPEQVPRAGKAWPVPSLFYHHVGTRVLVVMRLDGSGELCLRALEVGPAEFARLLFCTAARATQSGCSGSRWGSWLLGGFAPLAVG